MLWRLIILALGLAATRTLIEALLTPRQNAEGEQLTPEQALEKELDELDVPLRLRDKLRKQLLAQRLQRKSKPQRTM